MLVNFLEEIKDANPRPLWSVIIPTHNNSKYLIQTIESVLAQKLPASMMEIEVVDDFSTDDTEKVVRPYLTHGVKYFRQTENVKHIRNFETGLRRCRGYLTHLLHGDDKVLPGFYEKFTELFKSEPLLGAAFCNHNFIDENNNFLCGSPSWQNTGVFEDFFNKITTKQIIQTPSIVVKREVYEKLGMFNHSLTWCEDWEMWARIGKNYKVGFVDEVLAEYRVHTNSNSGNYALTGESIRDLKRGIRIINLYLDDPVLRKKALNKARSFYAIYALSNAYELMKTSKNAYGARNQLREAFLMSHDPMTNLRIIKTFLKSYFV